MHTPSSSPPASWPLDARLLYLLRQSGWPPGELAAALTISTPLLQDAIARLQSAGFEIVHHPTLGLQLLGQPDLLIADDLLARCQHPWLAEITVFQSTASTNDLATQRGLADAEGPLALFAETQTAGRGRFGRRWQSAPGEGIWMSVLVRPNLPLPQWPRLGMAAALAGATALEALTGARVAIKWPNDLLVADRKVCGILIETGHSPQRGPFAVIGLGLNVNQTHFPEDIASRATSLRHALKRPIDRPALAARLLDALGSLLPQLGSDFETLRNEVIRRSCLLGQPVQVHTLHSVTSGIAESLDAEGCLQVRLADGTLWSVSAGEVSLSTSPRPT